MAHTVKENHTGLLTTAVSDAMRHLPEELLNDVVLLQELRGWASHGQDIVSDPEDAGGIGEIPRIQKVLPSGLIIYFYDF
jgi:hypothetical protein